MPLCLAWRKFPAPPLIGLAASVSLHALVVLALVPEARDLRQTAHAGWIELASGIKRFNAPQAHDASTARPRPATSHNVRLEKTTANQGVVTTSTTIPAASASDATESYRLQDGSETVSRSPYFSALISELRGRLVYPRASRLHGEQGRVEVTFRLMKSGEVRDIVLSAPSPHPRLNEAALELVRGLSSFDPIPEAVASRDLILTIPFDYQLR